ncbi:MAG TPA: glycosyltransferase [Myxococcales bacterium]|nr:glycosyltransferase [Myxococcales bacterium]
MTSPSDHALSETLGPLFDEAWYAARYPEALASGLDPLAHYLAEGDATGNRPHPLFDPAFYSEQHPEIAKSAGARLKHYAEVGEPGGAWPNPLFDPRFYLEANPDLQPLGESLLAHYYLYGSRELRAPNPIFDSEFYLAQLGPGAAGANPLVHYMEQGDLKGFAPHALFAPAYYGSQHPELPVKGGARLAHYLQEGGRDGTNPHPLFQSRFYLDQCPPGARETVPALGHYLAEGEVHGLAPNPLFDPEFYRDTNPDLVGMASLLSHYLRFGAEEGRAPNPLFVPEFYTKEVWGRAVARCDLLAHYLEAGEAEGLRPHPLFDPTHYAPHAAKAGFDSGSLLGHYLRRGGEPGNDPHPLFDSAYYAAQLSGPQPCKQTLLGHYLASGEAQNLKPNPLFDPAYYAKKSGSGPSDHLLHYVSMGGRAGLAPSCLFDSALVLGQMPRESDERVSPLEYYFQSKSEMKEGPHSLFFASWYQSEHPEVADSGLDALSHFVEIGAQRGYDPHPLFNSRWYREAHPGHLDDEMPAVFHFLESGEALGLAPNPFFNAESYAAQASVTLRPGESPFSHFCRRGMDEGLISSRLFPFCLQFFRDQNPGRRNRSVNPAGGYLVDEYRDRSAPEAEIRIELPPVYSPDVSIVIPVFGQLVYTLACLRSISRAENEATYEVILIDDHSRIAEFEPLVGIANLRVFRNEKNLGFLRSCNKAVEHARGKDLVFLNNDTLVMDKWIDRLIETREAFPDAGLVGSQLLFPDGRLQEAGSVIWRDGSAINYGSGEEASDSRYAFARKVDYVSAAAVLIAADLFRELGGFDEFYAPAFYEDTDLAFRVREAGMDVVYQPASKVVHFGGASHGRDTTSGIKHHQVINQKRFFERWRTRLNEHYGDGTRPEKAAIRLSGHRALVVDATMLTPDRDAGSLRMLNLMKVLSRLGFVVTFIPSNLLNAEPYVSLLGRSGIQVECNPHISSIDQFLQISGTDFELCIVSRPDTAESCLDAVRLYCPRALVLYDTVDLHFLRREREILLKGVAAVPAAIREQELEAVARADATITVSEFDRAKLLEQVPSAVIHVVSLIHEVHPPTTSFSDRNGILFIGSFQHTPNVDAVLWFINEVLPIIHEWVPELRFHIIGSDPPEEIRDKASDRVIIEGFIENVDAQFSRRRLSIAPIRYGSGVKGKINQSMAYGLPCVATPPAVEGMDLDWESEILVADGAHHFAEAVAELYENETLWTMLSHNSVASIERSYSMAVAEEGVREIFRHHGRQLPEKAGKAISSRRG